MDPDSVAERLLARGRLLAVDPGALSPGEALDVLVVLQAELGRLAARETELLVRVAGSSPRHRQVTVVDEGRALPGTDERRFVLTDEAREEIAAALHRPPGQVYDEVEVARLLAGPLRRTRTALAAGWITYAHARAIAEQAARVEPDADAKRFADFCDELQERVLVQAQRSTPVQTRVRARRAVEELDRAATIRRQARARRLIDVSVYPEGDGLAVLFARLPVADAARLHAVVCARAASPDLVTACDATAGQRRAAALVDAVCGQPSAGATTSVEVQVTTDLATLLGLADGPVRVSCAQSGPQSIDADELRRLLDDPAVGATLRRLVTDPVTGHLLDRGRRAYAIPDALRDFIVTRDGTCRFPGCRRRASACQIDHATSWQDGGRTDAANLGALCLRHHQLKTHGQWRIIRSAADGSCTWRAPDGRTYDHEPDPLALPVPVPRPVPDATAHPPPLPEPTPPF